MSDLLASLTNFFFQNLVASLQMEIPMADSFRSEGKIYVVLAIALIILIGLFLYLLGMDRKIKRLEEKLKKKQ